MNSRYPILSLQDVVFAVHHMGDLVLEDEIRHTPMWVHVDDVCDNCKVKLIV